VRNELLSAINHLVVIVPFRDRATARRDYFLERALRGVPVAAFEREVVEDVAVADGAVPGWFAGGRGAEGWVQLGWGWGGEGEGREGSHEGEEEGEEHCCCVFAALVEGRWWWWWMGLGSDEEERETDVRVSFGMVEIDGVRLSRSLN